MLKTSLLDFLAIRLAPLGFKRSRQHFRRPIPFGEQAFHLSFRKFPDGLGILPTASLRHDELERLFHRLRGEPPDTPSVTLQPDPGSLFGFDKFHTWTLRGPHDVPLVGGKILAAFRKSIRFFFTDLDSLNSIYGLLSYDNASADSLCTVPHVRCEKALAACLLLGYQEEYDLLVDDRIEFLLDIDDPHLAEFLAYAARFRRTLKESR